MMRCGFELMSERNQHGAPARNQLNLASMLGINVNLGIRDLAFISMRKKTIQLRRTVVLVLLLILGLLATIQAHAKQEVAKPTLTWYWPSNGWPVEINGKEFSTVEAFVTAFNASDEAQFSSCISLFRNGFRGPCRRVILSNPKPGDSATQLNGIPNSITFNALINYVYPPLYSGYDTTENRTSFGILYSRIVCSAGSRDVVLVSRNPDQGYISCVDYSQPDKIDPPICKITTDGAKFGNPIEPVSGQKHLDEIDFLDTSAHPLSLKRTYRSGLPNILSALGAPSDFGRYWSHNYFGRVEYTIGYTRNVVVQGASEATLFIPSAMGPDNYAISRTSMSVTGKSDTLLLTTSPAGWTYRRNDDEGIFTFNTDGKIVSHTQLNGWVMTYSYNSVGQLSQVTNQFGRSILFIFNTAGQMIRATTPDGHNIEYEYDSVSRLSNVRYPNNTSKKYVYENTTHPNLVTGVVDENNVRLSTYEYDNIGRAVSTERANVTNKYQVIYPSSLGDYVRVIDPLGNTSKYLYSTKSGQLAVVQSSKPATTSYSDAASRVQNSFGLIDTETDFLGFTNQSTWDTARRLKTAETRAAGRPEAQTTTTQWHPTLRLPTLVTETGRTTAMTYDALGNKLTETLTDTSVNPQISRTTAYTYNAAGLVATETAPNNAVTTYTYNAAGNPVSSTNALGHVTTMAYAGADGAAGRVTSMTAPTGLATSYTYDARGRLLSTTQAAGTSTLASLYTYTPSGQLASAALPSGHQISYQYDAAQRLVGWQDNRGARGAYTLDPMGNRTTEQIKNAAGQVVWQLARSINAINRVASETVGAAAGTVNNNLQSTYSYNANGSLVSEANGLQQTTSYGLDGLRRVTAITNAASATANLAYNALDAVTSAKDFKGATTATARDALGNALTTSSNDAGNQSAQYDALGLPKQTIDALGQATSITRDALGRPTVITQADGRSTQLR
jgi:YD repeat-containing protein